MNSQYPPDFVGYENLIKYLENNALHGLEGDLIEIGAFMGGGTVKLAQYAQKHRRTLYVVDIFEPVRDQTLSKSGETACSVYEAFLEGKSMFEVYTQATQGFSNIMTIRQDSKTVKFDEKQRFIFGFIDGCHQKSYVISDFNLIWPHLVSGGMLGFHDYEYDDWPEVTLAVKKILAEHEAEIGDMCEITGVYEVKSLLIKKR